MKMVEMFNKKPWYVLDKDWSHNLINNDGNIVTETIPAGTYIRYTYSDNINQYNTDNLIAAHKATIKELLKLYNMENLKELLNENVVSFTFRKVNGEERTALGTRAMLYDSEFASYNIINFTENDLPKGTGTENNDVIKYWDLEKRAWRSCRVDSVISINNVATPQMYIEFIEHCLNEFAKMQDE